MVAGGPLGWSSRTATLAVEARSLLAADGGANHLARLGLRPHQVIGDFDSITPATRAWVGEERMVHRPDQDRTDLDKALEFAFDEKKLQEISVLAALGGRVDHDLGNLGLLARLGMGDRLTFIGDDFLALAIAGEAALEAEPGEIWSFWTYDPAIRVSVSGVKWPIENAAVDAGGRPSVSNEATEHRVTVSATGGAVVVFRQRGKGAEGQRG